MTIDLIHEWDYLVELFGVARTLPQFQGHLLRPRNRRRRFVGVYRQIPHIAGQCISITLAADTGAAHRLFCHDGSYLADFGAGALTLADGAVQLWGVNRCAMGGDGIFPSGLLR